MRFLFVLALSGLVGSLWDLCFNVPALNPKPQGRAVLDWLVKSRGSVIADVSQLIRVRNEYMPFLDAGTVPLEEPRIMVSW